MRRSRVDQLRSLDRMAGGTGAYDSFRARVLQDVESLLLEREANITHPDPPLAVKLGLTAVLGVVDAAFEQGGDETASRDTLVRVSGAPRGRPCGWRSRGWGPGAGGVLRRVGLAQAEFLRMRSHRAVDGPPGGSLPRLAEMPLQCLQHLVSERPVATAVGMQGSFEVTLITA